MLTTCLDDPRVQTSTTFSATLGLPLGSNALHEQLGTALEIQHNEYSPTITDDPLKSISGSQYDLRALPTYLSERTRRPSGLTRTRKDSDLSILTDAIQLQTLTPIIPGETTGAKPACSGDSLNTTYAPASISSPKLSKLQKRNSMVQFLALCWSIFLLGWNDGSTGPLLPRIQEHYRVC